jgi:NAD(P)H-dependent FMN reductase
MAKIAVIIGSTRESRFADIPARWIYELARKREDWDVELVDIREFDLPLFNELSSNAYIPSQNPNAVRWQKKIAEFDGYIFVTAEYNRSVPGSLKNAIDQAYVEWNRKPMAALGYGSTGAARAVEHLRTIAIELQMVPVRSAVHIGGGEFFKVCPTLGKQPISAIEDVILPSAKATLDDLAWWTDVTMKGRAADEADLAWWTDVTVKGRAAGEAKGRFEPRNCSKLTSSRETET